MIELICLLLFFLSYFAQQKQAIKQERILVEYAEIRARMVLLRLTLVEEERAYQRVLEDYR